MKKLFVIILTFSCLIITNNLLGQTSNCAIQIIPNDTTFYSSSPVQIQLNTDTTAYFYHWSGNNISDTTVRNPIVTALPNSSNQYTLQAMFEEDSNLVPNGDFEQGNTGFTSDLTYDSTYPLNPYGYYAIANSTNQASYFYSCTHNGNMMVIDGPISTSHSTIYQNTINVQPNSNYYFSFDAIQISTIHSYEPYLAVLQIYVNNVAIAEVDTISNQPCDWHTYHRFINSDTNSSLTIKIVDLNTSNSGNDFAIDNVSMKKLCVAYDTINISVFSPTTCQIQIIPNDTIIYSNSSVQVQLNTDVPADYYAWKPNNNITDTTLRNPVVTLAPNSSNQYTLQAMYEEDSNLVPNGDFEQGNTGFTTDLLYSTLNCPPYYGYYIINTAAYASYLCQCTNNSNMMIVDGSTSPTTTYQTNVNVQPNTYYIFSCEATNINDDPEFQSSWCSLLQFYVNNNPIGSPFYTTSQCCDWHKFYQIVNSGNSTTLTISIKNLNTSWEGNDFALDNVSLKKLCIAYDTVNIQIMPQIDTISDYICKGETYTNYGLNVDTGGYYSIHYTSRRGYDSVLVLNLIEITPFTDTINVDIYRGDTFTMYGFNAFEDGTYINSYQDIYGCDSSYVLNLRVILLMFPTVVTANGDGVNDIFEIHDLLNETFFTENELYIYSRYGKQVYHKKNIKTKEDFWNPQSTDSATGSYFYRFTAKGRTKKIDFSGSLEVIR